MRFSSYYKVLVFLELLFNFVLQGDIFKDFKLFLTSSFCELLLQDVHDCLQLLLLLLIHVGFISVSSKEVKRIESVIFAQVVLKKFVAFFLLIVLSNEGYNLVKPQLKSFIRRSFDVERSLVEELWLLNVHVPALIILHMQAFVEVFSAKMDNFLLLNEAWALKVRKACVTEMLITSWLSRYLRSNSRWVVETGDGCNGGEVR